MKKGAWGNKEQFIFISKKKKKKKRKKKEERRPEEKNYRQIDT